MTETTPDRLRIGLLLCGHVVPSLAAEHGDYPDLFERLLAPHQIDLVTFDVVDGPVPSSPLDCDGWLVSGSASSAYDDLPWIAPVEEFLQTTVAREVPLVAICFGHQVLAKALGGRVERSPAGWGVGIHRYNLVADPVNWPAGVEVPGDLALVASHQDQVVALPDEAGVVASTAHCPVAAFTVGERTLAIQPHPEFGAELSRGLSVLRRDAIGPDTADAALASLDTSIDSAATAAWMAATWRA